MALSFDASNGLFEVMGHGDFSRAENLLGLLPEQVTKAVRTATTKAMRWAEREGAKRLANVTKLSVRQLREATRYKAKIRNRQGQVQGRVWFGLNDVALKWAGATQTPSGVSSRVGEYRDAFIVEKLNQHVFRRKGATRLPIQKVTYGILGTSEAVLAKVADEAARMFQQLLFSELDKLTGKGEGTSAAILGA
jgi:hypothetical protein